MINQELIKKFKGVGVKEIPTVVTTHPKTKRDRAEYILNEHIKQYAAKQVAVITRLKTNEWGVLSFTRKEFSKVSLENDEWNCDCPSFRFGGVDGECKHILAIKIAQERNLHLPTIDDAIKDLYNLES